MRILPCGPRARLIEHDDPLGYACGLRAACEAGLVDGIVDIIPAESTVLVTFDREPDLQALERVRPVAPTSMDSDTITIPVVYDGDDLDEVAHLSGLTVDEVIAVHTGATYRVAFCGFAPGFAYLTGTDPLLHLPRRDTPRARVPAGSVAIAAGYSAVYPLASPGGWHLLGRTDVRAFDPARTTPALLRPGMQVRFERAAAVADLDLERPRTDRGDRPTLEVLDPGPLAVIQDLGRPGYGEIAVGESGAFDRRSHRLANRLVGNPESAAAIEALGAGLRLRALRHCVVGVAGATGRLTVDGVDVDRGAPVHLAPDQVLALGTPARGIRSVIAVRGGIDMPAVLGSLSHDTLSGLGPAPLATGTVISAREATGDVNVDYVPLPEVGSTVVLDVHPGPRSDRLSPSGRATLADTTFSVGAHSDRIGVRLDGPPVEVLDLGRLASEGVVRGSIQVPPDGQPVILGPDHPVTGGYPVVGVVADIDTLAQAVPGTPVRLRLVGW